MPRPRRLVRRFPVSSGIGTVGTGQSRRVGSVLAKGSGHFLLVVKPYSTSGRPTILSCVRHLIGIRRRIGSGVFVVPHICADGPHAVNINCGNVLRRPSPRNGRSVLNNVVTVHRVGTHIIHRANFAYTRRILCPRVFHCLSSLLSCTTINTQSIRSRFRHVVTDKINVPMNVGGPASNSVSIVLGSVRTTRRARSFLFHN